MCIRDRAYSDGLLQRRDASDRFARLAHGLGGRSDRGLGGGIVDSDPVEQRNQQIRSTLLKRRRKFEALRGVLTDPAACVFHIVLTAERLPVKESVEFYAQLSGTGVPVGGLVINRRSPADAGDFAAARRAVEDDALPLLDTILPHVPRLELPWLPGEIGTRAALAEVAQHL